MTQLQITGLRKHGKHMGTHSRSLALLQPAVRVTAGGILSALPSLGYIWPLSPLPFSYFFLVMSTFNCHRKTYSMLKE